MDSEPKKEPLRSEPVRLGLAGLMASVRILHVLAERKLITPGQIDDIWATILTGLGEDGEFEQIIVTQVEPLVARAKQAAAK